MAYSYNDLSAKVKAHRERLKDMMIKHGFEPVPNEWWHYNDADWRMYDLLNFPLEGAW